MEATLVYSTKDIKYHDRGTKFKSRINPITVSERVIDGGRVRIKASKVIIKDGKTKIIENTLITRNSPQYKNEVTLNALRKLNNLFDNADSITNNK